MEVWGKPVCPQKYPGASGLLPRPLTCRCSRSSSSFTVCTSASSAAEIRSTWCLGRAGGEAEGLSSSYWPCTLPRREEGLGQAGDAQGILTIGVLGSLEPSDTAAVTTPA